MPTHEIRNHRPDPLRAVKVHGPLNQELADRVKTEMKLLQGRSSRPITVYIKSRGGNIEALKTLEESFASTKGRPLIITVACRNVRSAAAYLLVMGGRAFAQKNVRLVFHGVRYRDIDDKIFKRVKKEDALAMLMRLEAQNRRIAGKLAEAVVPRIVRRVYDYLDAKNSYDKDRNCNPLALLKGYVDYIHRRISSPRCRILLEESHERTRKFYLLAREIRPVTPDKPREMPMMDKAKILKAIISSNLSCQPGAGQIIDESYMTNLMADYLFLHDLIFTRPAGLLRNLARKYGMGLLTNAELADYKRVRRANRREAHAYLSKIVAPVLLALWYFSMALCRRLMIHENPMRAADACWLGLVDEVLDPAPARTPRTREQRKRS